MTRTHESASGQDRYGTHPTGHFQRRSGTQSGNQSADGQRNRPQGDQAPQPRTRKPKDRRGRDTRSATPVFGTLGFYAKLIAYITGFLTAAFFGYVLIGRPINTYVLQPAFGITDTGFFVSYFIAVFILIYFWRNARVKHGF